MTVAVMNYLHAWKEVNLKYVCFVFILVIYFVLDKRMSTK